MTNFKLFLTLFYFIFSANLLCETACDPQCDPTKNLLVSQVEECEHIGCEISHKSQHNYTKDLSSDSSKKKFSFNSIDFIFDTDFIVLFNDVYFDQIISEQFDNHVYKHHLQDRKKFIVFKRLKVHLA